MACETDAAWAAGIIDGEGCIVITRQAPGKFGRINWSYRLSIKVAMNHEATVRKLGALFGGSIHELNQRPSGRAWNTTWQWWASARIAERILLAIRPYSITKAEEIALALEFLALPRLTGGNRRTPTDPREVMIREEYFQRMKALHPRTAVTEANRRAQEDRNGL